MLKQAKITINLLRTSRKKPKFPAYAKIFGQLDFNAMPMAPPVTKIIAHKKPTQHETWIKNGVSGWHIGPALEHYICYKVFVTEMIS